MNTAVSTAASPSKQQHSASVQRAESLLGRIFGRPFTILDGTSGDVLAEVSGELDDSAAIPVEFCRVVARRRHAEIIAEEGPLAMVAVPLEDDDGRTVVGVATFLTRPPAHDEELVRAASALGFDPPPPHWASGQLAMAPEVLLRLASAATGQSRTAQEIEELKAETTKLSDHLSSTYEEISLLYRLTQNLRISASEQELGRIALDWMQEVVPARGLALLLKPTGSDEELLDRSVRTESLLLTGGECPPESEQVDHLLTHLHPERAQRPVVVNPPVTLQPDWPCPDVHQVVAVPLAEGDNVFGWLLAVNHIDDLEFGTGEASLIASVSAILGIHSGNIALYREQSEMLAGVVRALSSAIDAKDPYTCGHSDRVARLSVRLAEELGCDDEMLNTIYLSGLLHDIGKIGIDDSVLRKPGKLTDEEFRHIKRHVEIGHKILRDLGRLGEVLPVILHHHESWDGGGYPHKLGGPQIPFSARIVAVADSYDAMSSDRPYRKGMPEEKIDKIFRSGSSQQWDPEVVEAFFRARDDIRRIVGEQPDDMPIDLQDGR